MKATYNIINDKLKARFDTRLSTEDYARMRQAKFTFWHGSKCFVAKWSPQAEDMLKEFGFTIEEDDTPDDLESRVDRFQGYAEKAEANATHSEAYLECANTARRQEHAVNAIKRELTNAEHWQERIEGAIRHAQYKERPDVIARRIRGLEADLRKQMNDSTPNPVQGNCGQGPDEVWMGKGRCGYWIKRDRIPGIQANAQRWIDHLTGRIAYETACLTAAGGCDEVLRPKRKKAIMPKGKPVLKNGKTPEIGGMAGINHPWKKRIMAWCLILKVNRTTIDCITVQKDSTGKVSYGTRRLPTGDIGDCKTPAEVKAEMPDSSAHWDAVQAILARNAERNALRRTANQQLKPEAV